MAMKAKIKVAVFVTDSSCDVIRSKIAIIDKDFEKNLGRGGHYDKRLYYAAEILNQRQMKEMDLIDSDVITLRISP
mgnify:CR=1 FL=1